MSFLKPFVPVSRRVQWTENESRYLLQIIKEDNFISELSTPMLGKRRTIYQEIYDKIARKMLKEKGYVKTATQCKIKWKHLKCSFHEAVRRNDRMLCPIYFDVLYHLLSPSMDKQMKVMARAMLVNMPTTNKQIVKKGVLQQKLEGIKEKNKFGLKNAVPPAQSVLQQQQLTPTQTTPQTPVTPSQVTTSTPASAPNANQNSGAAKKPSLPPLAPKPSPTNKPQANVVPQNIKQPPKLLPKPTINNQPPSEVCLRWNSYHSNMQNTFPSLLNNEQFVDVTLACDGRSIKCHKVMLSACSPYMEELLSSNPCQHPIVFLKDMKFWQLQALVDFMYRGEVNVTQDKLPSLLAAAEALQIKGLATPVNHSSPPKITQVHNSMPRDVDDMDQETYLRHLHLRSELKELNQDYSNEYLQDTDESTPPPTPKLKKRKLVQSTQAGLTTKPILTKIKTEKNEGSGPSTSTSRSILNQAQALLKQQQQQHQTKLESDEKMPDSDGEYRHFIDDSNRQTDSQDEDLDIDEEHAKMILERYSSQEDSYNLEGGTNGDDSTGSA